MESASELRGPVMPNELAAVAWGFLLLGIAAIGGTIWNFTHGNPTILGEWLGIPIFFGLRRYSSGWRIVAIIVLWVWLALVLVLVALWVLGLYGGTSRFPSFGPETLGSAGVNMLGATLPLTAKSTLGIAIVMLVMCGAALRILMRPAVRVLFRQAKLGKTGT
jgi:hypothetical protein